MRKILFILCISVFLFCGCTPKNEKKAPPSLKVTREKELYLSHCANCHGGNLEGSFGPPLNEINKKYEKLEILRIIHEGKGTMPAQDYISKSDQEELAKWLSKK